MSKAGRTKTKVDRTESKIVSGAPGNEATEDSGKVSNPANTQSRSSDSVPDFLSNFIANVAAFRRTTPMIVQITTILADSAKEHFEESAPQEDKTDPKSKELYMQTLEKLTAQQCHDLNYFSREATHYYRTSRGVPSLMLAAIIAETELLYAEMTKWCFQVQPGKIKSLKKSLELSDLDEAQSIDELRTFFLDKEIDELLRKNPLDQIESFEKHLDVEVKTAIKDLPTFLEVFERRNVMLHAGGKVSRQYLNSLRKFNYPRESTPPLNAELKIDRNYFSTSTRVVANLFTLFAFRVWHKHSKTSRKACDKWFVRFVYDKIFDEQYEECMQFLEMVERVGYRFTDKMAETRMLVNKAQCFKWAGDEKACSALLKSQEWSTHADYFILCVKVLEDDFQEAARIVGKIGKTGDIEFNDYCSWPVFKKAREHKGFCEAIEAVFGKPVVAVRPTRMRAKPVRSQKRRIKQAPPDQAPRSDTRH